MNKMNLFQYQVATGRSSNVEELVSAINEQEELLNLKEELLDLHERLLKMKPQAEKKLEYEKNNIDKMSKFLLEIRISTLKSYVEFHEKNNTIFIKRKN
jgi:hypothetical protein